jgi:hypothetical protein
MGGLRPERFATDAAVAFVTTEHFTLQTARAATIAESTGRATMFLTAVSGGLVALGLVATASHVGTAFFAFGLVLLPTLSFLGLVTFERTLQSGIEDHGYARRIARVRDYYLDHAPELTQYVLRKEPEPQLRALGLSAGRRQRFRTIAGMIAVVTGVLLGASAALVAAVASDYSLVVSVPIGAVLGLGAIVALTQYEQRAWLDAGRAPLSFEQIDSEGTRR